MILYKLFHNTLPVILSGLSLISANNPTSLAQNTTLKINGQYFLMVVEGVTAPNYSEVILKGGSPTGDFKPRENNPILTWRHLDPKRPNPITCAGHADLIQAREGDWRVVFCDFFCSNELI